MAGGWYIRWPKICKHYGFDPSKLCAAYVMSTRTDRDSACACHPKGHALHVEAMLKGQPFRASKHFAELNTLGLTTFHEELAREAKPPGTSKQVGETVAYPPRHFG